MAAVGLIARADSRGLGIQTHEFYRHMQPAKVLVVNCPSVKPLPLRFDWYPDGIWTRSWPTAREVMDFLDGLDVVFSAETFYNHDLPEVARSMGVKTVLQPNFELFDASLPIPDLFAAPSQWRYNELPDPKTLLPVPVATDRFTPNISSAARRFLHIVGRPAAHDRNGTLDLLRALQHVRSEITVTIRCQEPGYVDKLLRDHGIHVPNNVTGVLEAGDTENYWDNYRDQDVMVLPRRYGGLCLPAQESVAAGMPVIMPRISPNEWLPDEWLVPAAPTSTFMAKTEVQLHMADHWEIANRIDQFAQDQAFYREAQTKAAELAQELSWDNLKPRYEQTLAQVCSPSVLSPT